tara:strand:+ start:373 stop:528 length:156 start_codon:yes stop_codon:yes gene_type:complete
MADLLTQTASSNTGAFLFTNAELCFPFSETDHMFGLYFWEFGYYINYETQI